MRRVNKQIILSSKVHNASKASPKKFNFLLSNNMSYQISLQIWNTIKLNVEVDIWWTLLSGMMKRTSFAEKLNLLFFTSRSLFFAQSLTRVVMGTISDLMSIFLCQERRFYSVEAVDNVWKRKLKIFVAWEGNENNIFRFL